jgi:hypothetical protein
MSSTLTNFAIAVGATSILCTALMTHVQNRSRRRSRAAGSGSSDSAGTYSGSDGGFSLGGWFSSDRSTLDSSGNPIDGGSFESAGSDSGAGGDGGGGGDSGGGGGGD